MSIIYFLPDTTDASPVTLRRFGLDTLLDKPSRRETARGPNGSRGLLVAQVTPGGSLQYDRDSQVWSPRFGSDAWIGVDPANLPTPESLSRVTMVPGHSIELLDGNRWTVPLMRSFDADQTDGPMQYRCNLDQRLTQHPETGQLVPGDVVPRYASIWKQTQEIGDRLLSQILAGQQTATLDAMNLDDYAVACLSLNYRIEKPEISALGLLTVNLSARIMQLAIDWDTLRANLKNRLCRRASGGTNSESGVTPQIAD